jgi:hypothetical protein
MPVGRVGRRGMPVLSSRYECLRGCKIRAHGADRSLREHFSAPKKGYVCNRLAARIDGHLRAAEGARARLNYPLNYPKECWPDRHFIWLGPQQAVILPEFHAILLPRSNPSLIAQSRPIGPA